MQPNSLFSLFDADGIAKPIAKPEPAKVYPEPTFSLALCTVTANCTCGVSTQIHHQLVIYIGEKGHDRWLYKSNIPEFLALHPNLPRTRKALTEEVVICPSCFDQETNHERNDNSESITRAAERTSNELSESEIRRPKNPAHDLSNGH